MKGICEFTLEELTELNDIIRCRIINNSEEEEKYNINDKYLNMLKSILIEIEFAIFTINENK